MSNKQLVIICASIVVCLVALGMSEFVYCYFSGTAPSQTGTIVGAVAGFATGGSKVCWLSNLTTLEGIDGD